MTTDIFLDYMYISEQTHKTNRMMFPMEREREGGVWPRLMVKGDIN